jgi:fluoride ion exporter CrcB/FEX
MMVWNDAIAIGIGACMGAWSRYHIGQCTNKYIQTTILDPKLQTFYQGWHTAGINIMGSFLLGGITALPTTTATTTSTTTTSSNSIMSTPKSTTLPSSPSSLRVPLIRRLSNPMTSSSASQVQQYPFRYPTSFLPKNGISARTKLMFGVGFCGSFTTFSTFSVDVVQWLQQGQLQKACSYIAMNNVGGISAACLGMILVKKLL